VVTDDQIDQIIKAGQAAPSAKNRQPYYFIVIKNKNCRDEISQAASLGREKQFAHLSTDTLNKTSVGSTGSNDQSISEAPLGILILRNSSNYTESANESVNLNIKEEQGVATAAYSMMLAAKSLGLDSGWICSPLYIKDELKQILGNYGVIWQDNWQPRLIIPIGYAKISVDKPQRKNIKEISTIVE
jgi:nitroreductase